MLISKKNRRKGFARCPFAGKKIKKEFQMRAVYYEEFAELPRIENLPDPTPPEHGVVLRVKATGLCRSDWHGWMGHDPDITLPHVPGHEISGVIEAVGNDVSRLILPMISSSLPDQMERLQQSTLRR